MSNRVDIIDLSHHNTVPNFAILADAGLIGVFHKCSEGTTFTDDQYWRRRQPAEDAGLLWGAYHYLKHGNARDQMDFFMSKAIPSKGSRVAIDYEDPDCTLDDLHEAVEALQKMSSTLQLTVYSGHLIKEQLGSVHDELLAKTSLWIAQYTTAEQPSWPTATWPVYSLWQYTDGSSGGSPRSIAGYACDCNVFNGSRANCALWMGPAGQEPAPQPVPVPELQVGISIVAPAGTEISLIVNGEPISSGTVLVP